MYGIEAITANNGWAQALTGAIIVMTGLAILATVISILPKIINLFGEDKSVPATKASDEKKKPISVNTNISMLSNLKDAATLYTPIIESLGETFQLHELYRLFNESDIPHPHLTIKSLREAGYLLPIGEGLFTWKLI